MHLDVYDWIFIQTRYEDRYYCSLYFDTNLIDLDLDSRSRECENTKNLYGNYFTHFSIDLDGIWDIMETS